VNIAPPPPHLLNYPPHREKKDYERGKGRGVLLMCQEMVEGGLGAKRYESKKAWTSFNIFPLIQDRKPVEY
jgi:hypothetical protein